MKFDLNVFQSEPLLYFLTHSFVFVGGVGLVFFLFGLLFGRLVWGRYKRQASQYLRENSSQQTELQRLNHVVSEQAEMLAQARQPAPPAPEQNTPLVPVASPSKEVLPWRNLKPKIEVLRSEPAPKIKPPQQASPQVESIAWPRAPEVAPLSNSAETVIENDGESHVEPFSFLLGGSEDEASIDSEPAIAPPDEGAGPVSFLLDLDEPTFDAQRLPPATGLMEVGDELPDWLKQGAGEGFILDSEPMTDSDSHCSKAHDLTALLGLTPAQEQDLHAVGIYNLEQIADWDVAQIQKVSTLLGFADQGECQRWVAHARHVTGKGAESRL